MVLLEYPAIYYKYDTPPQSDIFEIGLSRKKEQGQGVSLQR